MTIAELLKAWEEGAAKYGIDLEAYPTPDKGHDLIQELEYELGSLIDTMTDKQVADNVRAQKFISNIAHQWYAAEKA